MTALIYCPFPDAGTAERIGAILLDEGLAGCINIGSPVRSLYQWDAKRGESEEIPALIKTDAALLDRAIVRVEGLHPYDAPAIVGWCCDGAGTATRAWLGGLVP
ncbi:divalent-cation tolerance protein CutA [Qipengyuania zhejiangensis]|uniref:divalent-cation tolerance protein CutA n=1 Tax=Qipengyuania zhejiangensis TaxID=3077782 RepID=UPI002D79D5AE|nr:divalent-cation tolerance protein CutA [Qipengyuania sp. Z2]